MKLVVADYQYRTMCLRIVATNGLTIRLTHYPRDLKMSNGQVYLSAAGYDFTSMSAASGTSPSMVDFQGICNIAGVTKDRILSGVFDNARSYLFATTWNAPIEDEEEMMCSILGKATVKDNLYIIEEMSLIDALNQTVGKTYTAQCTKKFGGQEFAGCKKIQVVVSGTVKVLIPTATVKKYSFQDNILTNPEDFFTNGSIVFTSGDNLGLPALQVKKYKAGGIIEVYDGFWFPPKINDAFQITEGCLKTKIACKAKSNIMNFGGFPSVPPSSVFAQRGTKQ